MSARILFVDEDPGRTGSTVSMEYLLEGFRSRGHEVFVLTSKKDPALIARMAGSAVVLDHRRWAMTSMGLNLYFTNTQPLGSWRGAVVMLKEIAKSFVVMGLVLGAMREHRIDLLYANEYVLVPAYLAARLRGVPSVVHVRSRFLTGRFGVRRGILARMLPAVSGGVVAITRIEAAQLRPREKDRGKIHVIGEFVHPADGRPGGAMRSASGVLPGLPPGARVVTMLGGILSFKGSREFVAAAARVSRVRPDAVFVIAGRVYRDGNDEDRRYYEECMKEAESIASPGCLKILGELADTADLLAVSDVLVSPSSQTHFSRPVIEAWAHGVPVVAVRTDHMSDLVSDGIDGFLTDPGDVAGLARAVVRLLDGPELCRRLGEAGKKKVAEQFDAEKNISKIVSLCERLVGPGRGGDPPSDPGSVFGSEEP